MGILWLIIKIILWALLLILILLAVSVGIVLFTPIHYQIAFEKYERMYLQAQISFSKILSLDTSIENEHFEVKVRVFKWCIYPRKPKKVKVGPKVKQQKKEIKKESTLASKEQRKIDQKYPSHQNEAKKEIPLKEKSPSVSSSVSSKEAHKKLKQNNNPKEKQDSHTKQIVSLLFKQETRDFSEEILRLIGKIAKVFKPYTFYFDILIGLDDPGETGIWMSKIILLYPWYYPYGNITGNYEEQGVWGEVKAKGKFRIGSLVTLLIRFMFDKETREFIHLLITFRKEEKNGK